VAQPPVAAAAINNQNNSVMRKAKKVLKLSQSASASVSASACPRTKQQNKQKKTHLDFIQLKSISTEDGIANKQNADRTVEIMNRIFQSMSQKAKKTSPFNEALSNNIGFNTNTMSQSSARPSLPLSNLAIADQCEPAVRIVTSISNVEHHSHVEANIAKLTHILPPPIKLAKTTTHKDEDKNLHLHVMSHHQVPIKSSSSMRKNTVKMSVDQMPNESAVVVTKITPREKSIATTRRTLNAAITDTPTSISRFLLPPVKKVR
jgi:hypothetical protein